jgi:hypothetical protein
MLRSHAMKVFSETLETSASGNEDDDTSNPGSHHIQHTRQERITIGSIYGKCKVPQTKIA